MVRVGVVGAGVAGASAAIEAARAGADVTIFESSGSVPTTRSSWPSILSGGKPSRLFDEATLARRGVRVELGERVARVEPRAISLRNFVRRFDGVVVTTGSAPVHEALPGGSKRGTHTLGTESDFLDLSERMGSYTTIVVNGSGFAAATVADRLNRSGAKVALLARSGLLSSQLSQKPRSLLLDAAKAAGIRIAGSAPDRVVGVDRVEAVMASGTVIPCDAFVVVPCLRPSLPSTSLRLGRNGGAFVDEFTAWGDDGVFAAGDCAEVALGTVSVPMISESSASTMGRVAGANSSGARILARVTSSYAGELFGSEMCVAGLTLDEAKACGLGAEEFSKVRGDEIACSLVVEVGSLKLLGAQLAGKGARGLADLISLVVSDGIDLVELAYLESPGSTDISPVAETATEALNKLASNRKGIGLRPR